MDLNTTGFQDLIMTIMNAIVNFDLKQIDLDYLGELLDYAAPIWNPIWKTITELLGEYIGL